MTLRIAVVLLAVGVLSACVARTQEFHCVLEANPADTFEMSITPTQINYRTKPFRFKEESGTLRRYTADNGRSEIEFNAASGRLIVRTSSSSDSNGSSIGGSHGEIAWDCKRYEGLK